MLINPATSQPYEPFNGKISDLSAHDYKIVNGVITDYYDP